MKHLLLIVVIALSGCATTTAQINRDIGEIKQLSDYKGKSLPFLLQELRYFTSR